MSVSDLFLVAPQLRLSAQAFVDSVDDVVNRLLAAGVEVVIGPQRSSSSAGAAFAVGTVLGAIVLAALTAKR